MGTISSRTVKSSSACASRSGACVAAARTSSSARGKASTDARRMGLGIATEPTTNHAGSAGRNGARQTVECMHVAHGQAAPAIPAGRQSRVTTTREERTVRRVQVVTAACAALMWATAAGVPTVAAQGAGSGGAQSGSQAGSSSGATAGTSGAQSGAGDQSGAGGQTGSASPCSQGGSNSNDLQEFVEKATVANMAEIQLGQLALKQAQDPQVKQFAQMMVDEHTKALEQLRTAASSQGLQVASALDNKHQKLNDKLSKLQGSEFDRAYMDAMVDTHKDTEKLLKRRAGKSASGSEMTRDQNTATPAGTSSGTGRDSVEARTGATSGGGSGTSETGTSSVGTPGTTSGSTGTSGASSGSGMSASSSTGSASSMSAPKTADEWAAMTLPKVRAHLEQARSLEDQVKQSSRSNSGGDNSGGAGNTGSGSGSGSTGSGSTPPRL